MRRLFWLAMGITIGVLVVRRLSRVAEKLTPQGAARSLSAGLEELSASIRDFTADVRDAMSKREDELREITGMAGDPGRPETGRHER